MTFTTDKAPHTDTEPRHVFASKETPPGRRQRAGIGAATGVIAMALLSAAAMRHDAASDVPRRPAAEAEAQRPLSLDEALLHPDRQLMLDVLLQESASRVLDEADRRGVAPSQTAENNGIATFEVQLGSTHATYDTDLRHQGHFTRLVIKQGEGDDRVIIGLDDNDRDGVTQMRYRHTPPAGVKAPVTDMTDVGGQLQISRLVNGQALALDASMQPSTDNLPAIDRYFEQRMGDVLQGLQKEPMTPTVTT